MSEIVCMPCNVEEEVGGSSGGVVEETKEEFFERMKTVTINKRSKEEKNRLARLTFSSKNADSFDKTTLQALCWFVCFLCGTDFQITKRNSIKGEGHNECSRKVAASLVKPAVAKLTIEQIYERAYKYLIIYPDDKDGGRIKSKTDTKYRFDCPNCPHQFELTYDSLIHGSWCPYCGPKTKTLCGNVSCQFCFDRSVAFTLSLEKNENFVWLTTNEKQPREMTRSTHTTLNLGCLACGHNDVRIAGNDLAKGQGCCYCSHKKMCDVFDCEFCTMNSGLVHTHRKDLTIISHTDVELRKLSRTFEKIKVTCKCAYNGEHIFPSTLLNLSHGNGCPICKNKTEGIIHNKLVEIFGTKDVKLQASFEWCKSIKRLQFDFLLKQMDIILECDGKQHFEPVAYFNKTMSFEEIWERDRYKEKCAMENGYSIIRLTQHKVLDNHNQGRDDWANALCQAIFDVIDQVCETGEPVCYGYAY